VSRLVADLHHILRFPAQRDAFEQAFTELRRALDTCHVPARAHFHAELAFEEVVSNIIRHGCNDGCPHHIDLSLACHADRIVITFDDDGLPFNPLERATPTLPKTLEEAPLGGLGLLLLRKTSTQLQYERLADHKNRLIVTIATI
jgi:anti-sigma regulatory factor (Ser/Thr protein kinase)